MGLRHYPNYEESLKGHRSETSKKSPQISMAAVIAFRVFEATNEFLLLWLLNALLHGFCLKTMPKNGKYDLCTNQKMKKDHQGALTGGFIFLMGCKVYGY